MPATRAESKAAVDTIHAAIVEHMRQHKVVLTIQAWSYVRAEAHRIQRIPDALTPYAGWHFGPV